MSVRSMSFADHEIFVITVDVAQNYAETHRFACPHQLGNLEGQGVVILQLSVAHAVKKTGPNRTTSRFLNICPASTSCGSADGTAAVVRHQHRAGLRVVRLLLSGISIVWVCGLYGCWGIF